VDCYVKDGLMFFRRDGGKLRVTLFQTLKIDPRGHFTRLRCSIIIVLDKIMERVGYRKPLVEICEFFANYPVW